MEKSQTDGVVLRIDGEVQRPLALTFADLRAIAAQHQVPDVSQLAPKRSGGAIRLEGLLAQAGAKPTGDYLTLHSSTDDFHASIPLAAVRDRAVLIYRLENEPLPIKAGGPVRFFIPDHAACHAAEVDECANVKFVDRIELTHGRGHDNRPTEDEAHAELHRRQEEAGGK
ncbi:MAG: molybdopterin-dependent oxidoreductase [Planctomycetes bacterium]|nr:molybdopterin-dependent oxidoreductase [Planctomycetota bacterium]